MDDVQCIPYRDTGYFSGLICDYLDRREALHSFYHRFPDLSSFGEQIKEKNGFPRDTREILARQLKQQYGELRDILIPADKVMTNISLLEKANTFTVTTGHQLSLFTGPLYFVYKIVSTVNLAKKLKTAYPEYDFVPVYWMASEDHDFAEINHLHLGKKELRWSAEASGPVGRLQTASLESVIREAENLLGPGKNAEYLLDLLRRSYLRQNNLAQATRYLVHELFGSEGLVIIDGDDANLKKLMIPLFRKDLLDHLPYHHVARTTEKLSRQYFDQGYVRPVNLFYIRDGLRERIEKKEDRWIVLNTELSFLKDELMRELEEHPERFSPNVILRPLYQETILPNLAYIGGGGELAYWLQLKDMFNAVDVPFPLLVLRNSLLLVTTRQGEKLQKLGLNTEDLFRPLHTLKAGYAAENAPVDPELEPYRQKLQKIFDELEEVARLTDKSMLGAVNAQRQKQLNGIENLRKKLIKAEKRRQSGAMERIEKLYYELFPGGSLQERHDNFMPFFEAYGLDWITMLLRQLDPLDFRFRVISLK